MSINRQNWFYLLSIPLVFVFCELIKRAVFSDVAGEVWRRIDAQDISSAIFVAFLMALIVRVMR
jgi:hypothetical protein